MSMREFFAKNCRVEIAEEMLDNVADDPIVIKRIISSDDTGVYKYDVENVQ